MVDYAIDGAKQGSYRFPGDFVLGNIDYINRDGEVFSLQMLAEEINVYQSIFQPFMKIEIAMNDSAGFINAQPDSVTGGEILYLSFKTSDPNLNTIKLAFLVNSIVKRARNNEGNEQYVIEGFSVEYFTSIDKKISKAFGYPAGKKITEIVQIIHDEYINTASVKNIYKFLGSNQRQVNKENYGVIRSDSTTGLHQCVIPNMNPVQAIRYLIRQAVDDDLASRYYFYERFDGFYFSSLGKLVNESPKYEDYIYYPSTQVENNYFNITNMERVKDVNITENMAEGLYASTTVELDPLRKNVTTTEFHYENESFNSLNELKVQGGADKNAIIHLKTSRRGHDTDSFFSSESPISSRDVLKDPFRDSFFKQITNNILRLTMYGNSDINVGDSIRATFNNATSYEDGKKEDKYTSGKYLITNARHQITKTSYMTVVECVKDTGTKRRANTSTGGGQVR
mgnify:FL=1